MATIQKRLNSKGEASFHDLRHSAASYLAMNGAYLSEIAEVLGHKTLAMVKRYAHLSEAHTTKVVTRMNEQILFTNQLDINLLIEDVTVYGNIEIKRQKCFSNSHRFDVADFTCLEGLRRVG